MCWAPVKEGNEDALEPQESSGFCLGEKVLEGALKLGTEGWVGVYLSEREGIPGRRNSISKGSEACFVWRGVKSPVKLII